MARLVDLKELESCLARSEAKEVTLDGPITEALMYRLATQGSLQYFPHFPRPYFRIDHRSAWLVQGIIGHTTLRLQLFGENRAETLASLQRLIEDEPPGALP